jgi:predicted Zn-dependent peptidase
MKKIYLILQMLLISSVCGAGGSVNQFTLPNGLKVIHHEITTNPLVTVQLFARAGAIHEQESEAGLSGFTQSLLAQGTATRDADRLARDIEDIGGSLSSDCEHDYCTLGISLMDSFFPKAMELLADIAFHPSFPEREIEKERMNTLASIKSRHDQIFYVANDTFSAVFYGDHPYSWPDIGKAQTVASFTRADCLRWHTTYYTADNMLLVIAGNIPLKRAKTYAEQYFSSCPRGSRPAGAPTASKPQQKSVTIPTTKFKQAYLMVGFPAPDIKSTDFPVLKVVNSLLGSRMSGRLFTELREKQSLGYEVNSFYPSRITLSRFVIYLGLEKKNLAKAKDGIIRILDDLKNVPVSAKELEETKNFIRGIYLLDHQTIGRQAWNMGFWEIVGRGYEYDAAYLDELMAVTAEDVQKATRACFTDTYVQVEVIPQ